MTFNKKAFKAVFGSFVPTINNWFARRAQRVAEYNEYIHSKFYLWGMTQDEVKQFEKVLNQVRLKGSVSVEEFWHLNYLTNHHLKKVVLSHLGIDDAKFKMILFCDMLTPKVLHDAIAPHRHPF